MLNKKVAETVNQVTTQKTPKILRFIILIGLFASWGGLSLEAAAPGVDNVVKICFADSKGQAIPYYTSHRVYLAGDQDRAEFRNYIQNAWDELLPHEEIGGGIGPSKNDTTPYFIRELDLAWWDSFTESALKRFKSDGYSGPVEDYFYYVFPNGYVHILARSELEKLKRDQINVLVIDGDLGSGQWKDLGNFLFKAAYYWRVNKGSQKDLLKQCDSLIEANLKTGNLVWAGNLSSVREMWLGGTSRSGLFGHREQGLTSNEDKELPWRDSVRSFGRGGSFILGKPLQPYRASKKALELNPFDSRALFWTRSLPWINGFSPTKTNRTSDDYIKECNRVWLEENSKLLPYHKFWFLTEFLETCEGLTFSERNWLKKIDIKHNSDIDWAITELESLIKHFTFLRLQTTWLNNRIDYLRDSSRKNPIK